MDRWKYNLTQVAYFEEVKGLDASNTARLWRDLAMFGNIKSKCYFYNDKTRSKAPRQATAALGFENLLVNLAEKQELPICGVCTVPIASVEGPTPYDFQLFQVLDVSKNRGIVNFPSHFLMSASNKMFAKADKSLIVKMLLSRFALLDRTCRFYGFVDVSHTESNCAGMAYGSMVMSMLPVDCLRRRLAWFKRGFSSGKAVLGLNWGNYFGPDLLIKLGGKEDFVSSYTNQTTKEDGSLNAIVQSFENGVFVSLTSDPADSAPGAMTFASITDNLEWLLARFDDAGIEVI